MKKPFVSIIVPSRDSEKTIDKLLNSLFSLNHPKGKYEVIVVDSSRDKTSEIVKKYPAKLFKIPRTKGRNISVASNAGIKASKGEFLAFVDSDCFVGKNWLNDLLGSFSSRDIACAGGKVITTGNIFDKYVQSAYKSPTRDVNKEYVTDSSNFHKRMWPLGSNFMARKVVINEVRHFDERLRFYEEVDLFWRICKRGYKLLLIPNAKVKHSYRRSFLGMFNTYVRYGMGCGHFCKKYTGSKFAKLRLLLLIGILVFYSFFAIGILPVFSKSLLNYFILLPIVFYLYLFSYYFSKKQGKFSLLFPFLDFTFCGIAYILGMIYSLIKPAKSPVK